MKFRKLQLTDKALIEEYTKNNPRELCDYCFSALFLWKDYFHTEIAAEAGILYIRQQVNGEPLYFMPLGDKETGIQRLTDYTRRHREKLRIINIEEADAALFEKSFVLVHTRGNDDYLYSAAELSLLAGKKFKSKRNLVNSFQAGYRYEVKPISEFDEGEDMDFLDLWDKAEAQDNPSLLGEKEAVCQALKYRRDLKLDGLLLKAEHRVVGLTVGYFAGDTFITHFEKAEHSFGGASQMINYLLANYVKNRAVYINREEDLGILGLRQAKLSYRPIRLIKSYTAYYRKDYENIKEFTESGEEYEGNCFTAP